LPVLLGLLLSQTRRLLGGRRLLLRLLSFVLGLGSSLFRLVPLLSSRLGTLRRLRRLLRRSL
jgi:hypothetical protein